MDFKKLTYNKQSYKNAELNITDSGIEISNTDDTSFIPSQNVHTIETVNLSKINLKAISFSIGLMLMLLIVHIFTTVLDSLLDIGLLQMIGFTSLIISFSYLFSIILVYIGVNYDRFTWYAVVIENEKTTIKLLYETQSEQKQAYQNLIENF